MTVIQTLDNYWDNVIKMFGNGDKTLPQCKYKENEPFPKPLNK